MAWSLSKKQTAWLAAAGLGIAGVKAVQWLREEDLRGQAVLITGGSRGLGFLLAREFAKEGCRVAICARDEGELKEAHRDLEQAGGDIFSVQCDVSDRLQVDRMVNEVGNYFGRIDILVNNAGIIQVGPLASLTEKDFEDAHSVMFWGMLHPTLSVLPQMMARGAGRVVNITSIGGMVSVPHLLPYNSAKFAAVGLSEGLHAELARFGVKVTTIVPGTMRTGSHLNAFFKGEKASEYSWFALGASLPFLSIDAERAARQIVRATKRGEAMRILGLPAQVSERVHGLFPGTTANVLGVVNRLLPKGNGTHSIVRGEEAQRKVDSPFLEQLTALGQWAAARFHEIRSPQP